MFSEIVNQLRGELAVYHPFATISERAAWDGLDQEWRRQAVRLGEEYLGFEWPYMSATDFMDFSRTGNRIRFETRFFFQASCAERAGACGVCGEQGEISGRYRQRDLFHL